MNDKYKQITDIVKADIDRVNTNLIFDIGLNKKLSADLEKLIQSNSKRIRSLVTILYMRASKMYLLPEHYELLSAVELIHNASLIHDDVIDDGKLRRGRKTLNEKFDNNLAVISGDYLLGLALKKLTKIGSLEILDIFADTIKTMCTGEVNQFFNKYKKIKIDEYTEKSLQKTSSLFEASLRSAILLAEAEFDEKTEEFISNFGLAFQIRDDLLNVIKKIKQKKPQAIMKMVFTMRHIYSLMM